MRNIFSEQLGTKAINAIQPNIVKKPAALAQINQHYNAKLADKSMLHQMQRMMRKMLRSIL